MIIKVKADAKKEVKPDYMSINIKLESIDKEKINAMSNILESFKQVEEFFKINNKIVELKTSKYDVKKSVKREQYEEMIEGKKYTKYDEIFLGYLASQIITVDIPIDILFVTKLMAEIAEKDKININVHYFLKDKKDFQDDVIKEAINRAKEKAEVIAKTFNKNNIECKLVDYTYNEYNNFSNSDYSYNKMCLMENSCRIEEISKTLEPTPIILSESIYSEWEI